MVAESGKAAGGPVSRLREARRRVALFAPRDSPRAKLVTLAILVALTVAIAMLTLLGGVSLAPPAALALPVVLGGILLDRPALRMLLLVVAVAFVVEIANKGWRHALTHDPSFALGLNTHEGSITCAPVAEAHGLPSVPLAEVLT